MKKDILKQNVLKRKTPMAIVAAVVTLGIATAGLTATHAANSSMKMNHMDSLVTAISQKFNLNEDEVQAVFDEQHAAMETEMKQKQTDRLNQAVQDGELTQEQADAISAKMDELKTQHENMMESMEGKTEEERHTAMKEQMESLKQWAEDNDIPEEYMMFKVRMHGGQGVHAEHSSGDNRMEKSHSDSQ